jgi:S-adenosylmethionine/arginine decarboxylase-like enzyme
MNVMYYRVVVKSSYKEAMNNASTNWGKSVAIDLKGCDFSIVSDMEKIQSFVRQIVKVVDMKAHGPIHIDRFGQGNLEGWSAMQFIETSSITVHADEFSARCFVDIFSCKDFDEKKAEEFSKRYFKAKESKSTTLLR